MDKEALARVVSFKLAPVPGAREEAPFVLAQLRLDDEDAAVLFR